MRFVDIIEKKKQKQILRKEEIEYWIQGLTEERIPDYQSAALLMAIVLNGMNQEETTILAKSMMKSGEQIDLSNISGMKVDKHSRSEEHTSELQSRQYLVCRLLL